MVKKEPSELIIKLRLQLLHTRSMKYADNRLTLYTAQKGKCAVTGKKFTTTAEIHCHHKIPKSQGGNDEYSNLISILEPVHKLIHAIRTETIQKYLKVCKPDMKKLNVLRKMLGNSILSVD